MTQVVGGDRIYPSLKQIDAVNTPGNKLQPKDTVMLSHSIYFDNGYKLFLLNKHNKYSDIVK